MVDIYVDGAYSSNRNLGGWAFIVLENGEKIHMDFGSIANTTNNRMEQFSVLKALEWSNANNFSKIEVISDSFYVIKTLDGTNWKIKKNQDLWELIKKELETLIVKWTHVKGHSNNKWNEICDYFAVLGSNEKLEEWK